MATGKGKTTAALGLALRAAGRGMKTFVAQFLKKGEYGELLSVRDRLAELDPEHEYIVTVRGHGFRLADNPAR